MFSSSPEVVKQLIAVYQLIGWSPPLFGLFQKLFAALGQSVALGDSIFGLTYICEEAFSQVKVIKSRYRNWWAG